MKSVKKLLISGVLASFVLTACVSAEEMTHWALLRDDTGEAIASINEGEEVEVLGINEADASRTDIYYPAGDLYGSVSSVYIYGGSDYEYEHPTEYGVDTEYEYYEEYESEDGYSEDKEEYQEEAYISDAAVDTSNVWVDIDIASQVITVNQGDEILLSANCVTGTAGVSDTPTGTFSILFKEIYSNLSGTDLSGQYYSRDVNYWMAVTEWGVGIHDAPWRDGAFGGDIYTYDGSLGCINVDSYVAEAIYGMVEEGTPVYIH
ncbi:MAG: L,D-transpeptidase [Blautia sp.]|nr:L,D-transpeptidase [Blautia sp.]